MRIGHDGVDVVDESFESRSLFASRARHVHLHLAADGAGIRAENHDAVGEEHGLFDVVGDQQNALGRESALLPEIADFTAEVLGGKDVERAERLVHHQHVGLHHEGAGEADALAHAAGELLGIGAFKAFEANHAERAEGLSLALPCDRLRGR